MSWQPIETAPNHECEFLAWDGFSVFVAYWYGRERFGETAQTHSPRPHITHWMPLPSPPKEPTPSTASSLDPVEGNLGSNVSKRQAGG